MTAAPDVLYVVRPGETNLALRYSLRSLANVPHGRVWIAGHMRAWVSDVQHVPTVQRADGHRNAFANLRAGLSAPGMSDRVILMNDDFYILKPLERIPVLHRGPLAQVIDPRPAAVGLTRAMLDSWGVPGALCYDLHVPAEVDRAEYARVLEAIADHPRAHRMLHRTLHAARHQLAGDLHPNAKVYDQRCNTDWAEATFLSTSPQAVVSAAGAFLADQFAEPSYHECDPCSDGGGT